MKYLYYPGCSLQGTAKEYEISTRAFMEALGAELHELEDWTCCGASAAESVSGLLSLALAGRNLAIAERMDASEDILVPCSACYLNLKRVEEKIKEDRGIKDRINYALEETGDRLEGRVNVRHLLDVLSVDVGPEGLAGRIKNDLGGLTIAPYYGCQCLRPYKVFDDPERPTSMEPLLKAVGAKIHDWDMGGCCCSASNMNTKPESAIELVGAILDGARGADAIVTVCPMCQMNLEAYQKEASRALGRDVGISVLYLPQLLGLAIGLSRDTVRLGLNLAVTEDFKARLASG